MPSVVVGTHSVPSQLSASRRYRQSNMDLCHAGYKVKLAMVAVLSSALQDTPSLEPSSPLIPAARSKSWLIRGFGRLSVRGSKIVRLMRVLYRRSIWVVRW